MNKDHIEILLEKYFEGETSIDEERTLKTYFNTKDVAEDHLMYSDLFNYFSLAQTEQLERQLDLNDLLSERPSPLRILRSRVAGIAAIFILVFASVFIIKNQVNTANDAKFAKIAMEDPEEALETTMEALAYLGVQFNKGTESMEKMKAFNKTQIIKD